jgi:hypothetical protein
MKSGNPFFVRQMAHCQIQGWYDLMMDALSCSECRAICLELREALSVFVGTPEVGVDPAQLGEWIRSLNEEECARIRETSSLWRAWRRLQEHRTLTGHVLSVLPLPPNAISTPN